MAPTVSILLPVFNTAPLLPACLASIRAQTVTDFELVAVDDGSTDGSGYILQQEARADPRVVAIRAPHQGVVAALNRGLAACRGRYIARMDSDDLMRPTRLKLQLAHLERDRNCSLVGSWVEPFGIGKKLTPGGIRYHQWLNSLTHDAEIQQNFFVDSPIAHSTFFARRGLFDRLQGYRDCPWAEDYDFLLRARQGGATFANVPQVLLERADRPERLTRTDPRTWRPAMFRAKAHHFARGAWLAGKAGVAIAGSGSSGRAVAGALLAEGVAVRCFVDNRPGPPGRTVMGIPAWGTRRPFPPPWVEHYGDAFVAVCVGGDAERAPLVARLGELGLRCGQDFLRFI